MTAVMTAVPSEPAKAYEALCERLKEISSLNGISGLLDWDEMVMMPPGAAASRGSQKAVLAGVLYDKETDPQLGALLDSLKAAPPGTLDEVQAAVVRDAAREYVKRTALPKELAQRIAKLKSEAYGAWVKARTESDFSVFAPFLKQWIEISKEKAKLIDPTKPVYDVLLDDYEKGATSARLDEVFTQVREGLVPLIAAIKSRGRRIESGWLNGGEYDTEKQAELCKKKDNVVEGLTGAIHETGHALYEQGRNLEYDGLPVNSALSMGVHESQSLLWERMVGLSRPFAAYLLPMLQERFPESFGSVTAEQLYESENVIQEPSLIRVEADEVTYPLHIILRYELEKGLLEGEVEVEDVPRLWNERMGSYLGATPPNDATGCLQDIHWSMGALGYFPTYTLGAMYATQIYAAAKKEIPDLEDKIRAGEFKPLKSWLNDKIHKLGSLHKSGDELMIAATGAPLEPSVFLDYLRDKYNDLYKL
ncbi:hypothetical protein VOLCADRAFT_108221 [Volvox carteri f. nagariensis]|uniref:Carboxypeptidase n=1 Tax=Volvox carteri f. nagariensis TaxID=3068 RepID=D8UIY5_VOLCA|nr:uncharacterized protein VOLCADRAFT_108221 [Volvox carteri f. nagariensis]EFJ40298.1 hypothetical protein VOLCADRAFT_108221 [Volvox carteri f. nagariensis]|eukprot:XP_002958632.1 hypothetical protein VOLCADRAFT_108221 [Volvox carteri f. nagariensis]